MIYSKRARQRVKVLILIVVAAAFVALMVLFMKPQVCVRNTCFSYTVADDALEQVQGLSNIDKLGVSNSKLFTFSSDTNTGFWMKDMRFGLDIIFIDSNWKIVEIFKNLKPCVDVNNCPAYVPEGRYRYVLEINEGLSDKYGFKKGDLVSKKGF